MGKPQVKKKWQILVKIKEMVMFKAMFRIVTLIDISSKQNITEMRFKTYFKGKQLK